MTRVLVTGATGFVGRHLLNALDARGMRVRAAVRAGKEDALADFACVDEVVSTPSLFGENQDWWAAAAAGADLVIHAAWYAEPGKYVAAPENLDCLAGTLTMARGCAQAGVRRFAGIGTCAEYDFSEGHLSTGTPLRPASIYAGTKAAAFLALSHWLPAAGTDFLWCRIFYLFGEGEDPRRLVPYLRARLAAGERCDLSSGNQIRDFLDVADAAEKIVAAATGDRTGPMNICSGVPITVRQMAEAIADEYGRRDLLNFGARPDNLIDPPCVVGVP
ncbi:NAD-dependent epimerase/dehydratase family protein [Rhizobium binxianense]